MSKFIGIDYGTQRVGIAVSDAGGTIAFPRDIVSTDAAHAAVMMIVETEDVAGVVIGESKDFKGKDNPVAEEARRCGARLGESVTVPIHWESEVLTSVQAEKMLRTVKRPEEQRASERVSGDYDASAAAILLQSFLDKQKES